nr:TauD/TfdA family dioxygenase [Streptomyces sp. CS147]
MWQRAHRTRRHAKVRGRTEREGPGRPLRAGDRMARPQHRRRRHRRSAAPLLERTDSGQEILRFSYNLLTTGQYDPPVDASVDPAELPLGSFGVHLAEQAEEFFRQEKVSVLIPEDSVLVWDNQRMVHARSAYRDARRHLTRYWIAAQR